MTTTAESGFAAQAARLVEAARANERAVRDLEEATQVLAGGIEDLAGFADTAEALRGLGEGIEDAQEAAETFEEAVASLDGAREAVEAATAQAQVLAERAGELTGRFDALDEALGRLEENLGQACARAERIDAVERKLDRLLEVLGADADAYAARVEPRLARLEAVAERMDMPALADELADVLAASYRVLERVDGRAETDDGQ